MKKIFSMLIAILVALFSPPSNVQPSEDTSIMNYETTAPTETVTEEPTAEEDQPVFLNHNTLQTSTRFSIDGDGTAKVYLDYMGYQNITLGAEIAVTIEQQNGELWELLYQRTFSAKGEYYHHSLTYSLIEKGIYRCTVVYTVSGIGSNEDVITFEDTKEYQPIEPPQEAITPAQSYPVSYPILTSLSANAAQNHIDYFDFGPCPILMHSEKGYIANDMVFGERYVLGDFCGIYCYRPDEKACRLFCGNAYCSHTDCGAVTAQGEIFHIGGRFYQVENGNIHLLSNDRWVTKWRSESGTVLIGNESVLPLYAVGWRNYLVYGPYIYITANGEQGEPHILRYDTNENTMSDLTADTGNFIHYEFIYDGALYGYNKDRSAFIAYDVHLQEEKRVSESIRSVFTQDLRVHMTLDTLFIGVLYDENQNSLGIMTFDIKTGEKTFFSNESLGLSALAVIYADDSHFYFIDQEHRGNIYRIHKDGSGLCVIYENESTYIYAYQMILNEDNILIYAGEVGMIDGRKKVYADGWHIGTLDENGNILSFEWLETMQ